MTDEREELLNDLLRTLHEAQADLRQRGPEEQGTIGAFWLGALMGVAHSHKGASDFSFDYGLEKRDIET